MLPRQRVDCVDKTPTKSSMARGLLAQRGNSCEVSVCQFLLLLLLLLVLSAVVVVVVVVVVLLLLLLVAVADYRC